MRSHFLQSVLGLTVLGSALVACGDDSAGTGGAGGSSSDSTTGATTPDASSGTTPVTSTGTQGSPTPASSGTGTECAAGDVFDDPEFQACNEENCCEELTACATDPESCFGADGILDSSLPNGGPLYECAYRNLCGGPFAAVCDSGIGFGNEANPPDADTIEFAFCLDQACCEEMTLCTNGGTDAGTTACIDCLNEDPHGELCDPINLCSAQNCEGALFLYDFCDSGIGSVYGDTAACITENCCDQYTACSGGVDAEGNPNDEDQITECLACLNGEGGELCDDVIACDAEFCSTEICDSGYEVGSLDAAQCFSENCCVQWNECTGNGADVDACSECFADGGTDDLCAAASECADTNCGEGGGGTGGGGTGGDGSGGGTGGAPGTGGAGGAG